MRETTVRNTYPCDGCALRRVRCEGTYPCRQCSDRSISCTFLRPRHKRGPKGRRTKTALKISRYQESLLESATKSGENSIDSVANATNCPLHSQGQPNLPVEAFITVLDIFQKRLYSIWPVVSCEDLIASLQQDEIDHESFALASSLCAASIAQLRLLDHRSEDELVSDQRFEREAQYHRSLFDYRETGRPASLLTSFFLHMYWVNNGNFRKAEWYLREAVIYALPFVSMRDVADNELDLKDRELQLRIYWVLFVTERTFCAEHNCQAILDPIDDLPQLVLNDDSDTLSIPGLLALAKSFRYLHKDVLRFNNRGHGSINSELTQPMVSTMQKRLSGPTSNEYQLNEVQRIDLVVTRNWIRTLLWCYAVSNFHVYCRSDDEAFSTYLPATIARDLSISMSSPTAASLRAHGYGMELKIFKVADSLLDVLACNAALDRPQSLCYGSRDLLCHLEHIILTVGGSKSVFLNSLRDRMAEIQLRVPSSWRRSFVIECQSPDDDDDDNHDHDHEDSGGEARDDQSLDTTIV